MIGRKAIVGLGLGVAGLSVLALPWDVNAPPYRREMAAVKAISTLHTAQTQYHAQYDAYATTLQELGPIGADLIDNDLASGEKDGFKFVLQQTPTGYALMVVPAEFGTSGSHTYFSDQSMTIHQHNGKEPATAYDPLLGEKQ